MDNVIKKAKEFFILVQPIGPSNALEFNNRVNSLLQEGWDVFASQSIGLDAGGTSGAGLVNMVVSLVRYDYIKLMDAPAPNVPA